MTIQKYPVYKGLQKPLIYKGFKGKFIGYGIGCLIAGLISGGLLGALTNMYLGSLVAVACIIGGLYYTASLQKKGLHSKTRHHGIFIQPAQLKIRYDAKKT